MSRSILARMREAIEVGDDATWPGDLRSLFADNFDALAGYEREERRIEETKYGPGGWGGLRRPANPFLAAHERVLARADVLGAGIPLVGHHCTRLTADEIENVRSEGMVPLSLSLPQDSESRSSSSNDVMSLI